MKIKNTYISFTGEINIGRYAHFIELNHFGVEVSIDELVKRIVHFPRVVILGDEPFKQKEELLKLIKNASKLNPNIVFEVFTTGTIRPVSLGNYDNIIYNVDVQLKHTGQKYEDRINSNIINWFNEIGANFKFNILSKDDIDEVGLILQEFGIKKANVFLTTKADTTQYQLKELLKYCKRHGYNFTLDFKNLFWEEENES